MKKSPPPVFPECSPVWTKIAGLTSRHAHLSLFLDYDGTLTPIRQTPGVALLAPDVERLLGHLSSQERTTLTIVTGRSMDDIRRLVPINGITFAANHGFHIVGRNVHWVHPAARAISDSLHVLADTLSGIARDFPGAFIEYKLYTITIHFRRLSLRRVPAFTTRIRERITAFDPSLIVTHGKEVLEVRPPVHWGKGNAILKILSADRRPDPPLAVFIGDDTTDEDGFRALRQSGITIRVGPTAGTAAWYRVDDTRDVARFLRLIDSIRNGRTGYAMLKRKGTGT